MGTSQVAKAGPWQGAGGGTPTGKLVVDKSQLKHQNQQGKDARVGLTSEDHSR